MKTFISGVLAIALLALSTGPLLADEAAVVEKTKAAYILTMEGMT